MKIYLAKSNAANFAVYSLVKQKLSSLGHEIIEFNGGAYDPNSILKADYLFIVPPSDIIGEPFISPQCANRAFNYELDSKSETYNLGRGQTDQILHFIRQKGKYTHTLIADEYNFEDCQNVLILKDVSITAGQTFLYVDHPISMIIDKVDWKTEWSHIYTDGGNWNAESQLGPVQIPEPIKEWRICEKGWIIPDEVPHLACRNLFK